MNVLQTGGWPGLLAKPGVFDSDLKSPGLRATPATPM